MGIWRKVRNLHTGEARKVNGNAEMKSPQLSSGGSEAIKDGCMSGERCIERFCRDEIFMLPEIAPGIFIRGQVQVFPREVERSRGICEIKDGQIGCFA